ncbi:photosynthetic reaction center subunit H [Nereida sp. MMG025]|uniref:photosynthetic reaction center subunit H n=1 Tax=Nereida sp. MMG025 TaxID=2909981 RepID=UPI001F0249F9|nr:photosynthetic reaction center subunit H [Nereida sp. MMG025]MCF6446010.1 photosynthetic reaction center subunit H [Nereida sp. MMG025]
MVDAFFGNFDLASLSIWLFWGFFAILIYYLQTENMREGYPLETDDGNVAPNQGPFPVPSPKTFKLPHGRGDVTVPGPDRQARTDLALEATSPSNGSPFVPTGDPMVDGVGPASWAARADHPELDGKGHPKIQPMANLGGFRVAAGRDPRGLPVMMGDGVVVGKVTDMWLDEPEQLVRFFEYEVDAEFGGGKKLVAREMARINSNHLKIKSIYSKHVANVPTTKTDTQITLLEEEKIMAYYGGGVLYADESRLEPQL